MSSLLAFLLAVKFLTVISTGILLWPLMKIAVFTVTFVKKETINGSERQYTMDLHMIDVMLVGTLPTIKVMTDTILFCEFLFYRYVVGGDFKIPLALRVAANATTGHHPDAHAAPVPPPDANAPIVESLTKKHTCGGGGHSLTFIKGCDGCLVKAIKEAFFYRKKYHDLKAGTHSRRMVSALFCVLFSR